MESTPKKTSVIPIFRAEALLIPARALKAADIAAAHSKFTYQFYNEKACKACDNVSERHNDVCDGCNHFKGSIRTSKIVEKEGDDFLSLPVGASKKVKKWIVARGYGDRYRVLERTPDAALFSEPIKFVKPPYEYQTEAVKVLRAKKRGILNSPPRSGKTIMGSLLACRVGKKTLILGSQREWLLGFQETFIGSETQEAFTDCDPSKIGICSTLKDFREKDICLATFSGFMSARGQKLLEAVRELFSVVLVDEVQGVPAKMTARILSRFNAEHIIGMSGTVDRKVSEEMNVAFDLIGPIIHTCEVERLRPRVIPFFTNVKFKDPKAGGSQAGFTYFQSSLESNSERRAKLVKLIIKYARAGHLVMVPVTRVNTVLNWVREINYETETRGFALPFFGGMGKALRDSTVQKARNYECRVIVGNISLLSTGLNIPRASCLVESAATSNLPKAEQRMSRILTPYKDKPPPVILYVMDDSDLLRMCKQKEFWGCLKPRFDPIINKEDETAILSWFSLAKKNNRGRDHGGSFRDGLD